MIKPKPIFEKIHRTPVDFNVRLEKLRLDKNEQVGEGDEHYFNEMIALLKPAVIKSYPEVGILYKSLSSWLKKPLDEIILANGSDAVIKSIFEVYISPGDEVLMQSPTYAMYNIYTEIFGGTPVMVKYDRELKIGASEFLEKINQKTKLVVIANPNSPTGAIMKRDEITLIIEKTRKYDSLVLIDEAYYWFYDETFIDEIKNFDNLIVTRTFSKACGLGALRLGFACACRDIIQNLYKMKAPYEVNGVAVLFGKYIIENQHLITEYVKKVKEGKSYIEKSLLEMGFRPFDTHSNFLVARYPMTEIISNIVAECDKNNILIKGCYPGTPMDDCIRITLGPVPEMKKVVECIKKVVKK